jgi:inner membrane protein
MHALYWLGAGILLLILELISFSGFLLWIAISAGLVSLVLLFFPALSIGGQFLLFSITALISCVIWRYYLQHRAPRTDNLKLNRRNEQYIGRVFTLEEAIVAGRGKIRVDDSVWRIEGEDLPAGTKVRVVGVDGVILRVSSID